MLMFVKTALKDQLPDEQMEELESLGILETWTSNLLDLDSSERIWFAADRAMPALPTTPALRFTAVKELNEQ